MTGTDRGTWRATACAAVLALASAADALGQGTTTTTTAPAPIVPIVEVAARAEEVTAQLRTIDGHLAPDPAVETIAEKVPDWSARLKRATPETEDIIEQGVPLQTLLHLARSWSARRDILGAHSATLARRALQLETDLDELTAARDLWTRTGHEARERAAPEAVVTRIRDTLVTIGATQRRVEQERGQVLALQDTIARLRSGVDAVLAGIEAARKEQVGRILLRDSPPIWEAIGEAAPRSSLIRVAEDISVHLPHAIDLQARHRSGSVAQVLLLATFVLLFRAARRRARRWAEEEPDLVPAGRVLERPYSSALLLTLLTSYWAYPGLPNVLVQVIGAAAIVPTLRILRTVTGEKVQPGLTAAGLFFLLDRVRDITCAAPRFEQTLFLLEMAAAVATTLLLAPPLPSPAATDRVRPGRRAFVPRVLLVVFTFALVAGSLGFMQLARTLGGGALTSAYLAMVLHAAVRALTGLLAYLLRARALQQFGTVRDRRDAIQSQLSRGLLWAAVALWVIGTLAALQLLPPVRDALRTLLRVDIAPGTFDLSLGNVAVFALTLWVAYLFTRFVGFVLEHDVYPRVRLPRGIPYATSTLLRYVVLAAGGVLALGALGIDFDRFTLLTGALGVGIGFGLQNVVNNFISGLILLFERPIQVGDVVQMTDVTGQVQRIGVRSSTIRTPQGAEVIVPNANLIQERVTNWTFADRMRRMELRVGVAYGSEPERVLALLREVALSHKKVLNVPAPQALFTGFGASSLDFEVWAWTARGDEWMTIRSDLAVALDRALKEAGIDIPFPQQDVHVRTLPGDRTPATTPEPPRTAATPAARPTAPPPDDGDPPGSDGAAE